MKRDDLLLFAGIAFVFGAIGIGVYMGARGIRNNNPGNIRHGGSKWQGMSAVQSDTEYVQFDDPVYGIRALVRLLKNYQKNYGLNTIDGIINRWAPPTENITSAYVEHVARVADVKPDQEINVNDYMQPIVRGIIAHENGQQPYTADQISQGISLA